MIMVGKHWTNIQIRLLPAKIMYRHYLENTKMNIGDLHL